MGNGVAANALRVTLASDGTGVVALSAVDNAVLDTIDAVLDLINAKLVTGTVIGDVNLGAVDNAVLDSIVTNTTGLAGTVAGTELQVDIVTAPTITVDWAGTAPPIGAGTEAAALRVTVATDSTGVLTVDGTVTANLSATDNAVLDTIDTALDAINAKLVTGTVIGDVNLGAVDNAVLDSIVTNTTGLAGTVAGSELQVDVVAALPTGTNTVGRVQHATSTTGGASAFSSVDLDETEEEIKATAGTIYGIYAWNTTAAPKWLQIWDNTAAAVIPGTTAPTWNFAIPANADSDVAGVVIPIPPQGIACGTGITMAITGAAGTDATDPGANAGGVFVSYA